MHGVLSLKSSQYTDEWWSTEVGCFVVGTIMPISYKIGVHTAYNSWIILIYDVKLLHTNNFIRVVWESLYSNFIWKSHT